MNRILIIGGGLIGLLSARELALGGYDVTLLERGAVGRESSWAGGGILSPLYPWRYVAPVTELARWSQAHYPALCEQLRLETDIDPEWTQNGLLMLDLEAEERDEAVEWAVRFGYDLEYIDAAATARYEPALGQPRPGIWMGQVAQVRNPRLLKAMRVAVEDLGVEIVEQCEVTGLLQQAGRVTGVKSARGEFGADAVVVCGGAWSAELLGELAPVPRVRPVRGQMLLFRTEPETVRRIVLAGARYVIPRRDGRVLVGSTVEKVGFDKSTTETAKADLLDSAFQLIPALASAPLELHWAGLRPGAPDGVPYIGPHPALEGLYLNAGHYRNGVVTGLASARLLADRVLGRAPVVDPAAYDPATARGE